MKTVKELDFPEVETCSCGGELGEFGRFSCLCSCIISDVRVSKKVSLLIQRAQLAFNIPGHLGRRCDIHILIKDWFCCLTPKHILGSLVLAGSCFSRT